MRSQKRGREMTETFEEKIEQLRAITGQECSTDLFLKVYSELLLDVAKGPSELLDQRQKVLKEIMAEQFDYVFRLGMVAYAREHQDEVT
jgi:hypothetical protein